ncbi:PIG-L deacetylase family protein [Gracilimonas halophila]|uniref:PIG-L deacetylase family protein n=1 Tax=Gracilimonas halophila TaxID=1834464 RepID=A0ABW5JLF6_9BACT
MKRVLIVSAHPDDDILGCGGFMAKYSSSVKFKVIFIAEGSSCRFSEAELGKKEVSDAINRRNTSGIKALDILGVKNVEFYNLPCGRLDQIPIININKIIEQEIIQFEPDTLFTHSENDANNDHKIVSKASIMATRPNANNFVEKVFQYEILSSSEWKFTEAFLPNYFEALTGDQIKLKWDALAEYETEVKKFPFPRSYEGIVSLAKYRGMQSGCEFAEAYRLIRHIRI